MIHEKNIVLRILTDNSAALSAINKAFSGSYHLASIIEMIWKRASIMKWTISASHIQGSFNVIADQLSRNTTISTEWSLPPTIFKQTILPLEPRLQVDLFATNLNNQLETYVSPCPDLQATAVDALTANWNEWQFLYLFPPHQMISRAFQKLSQSNPERALFITREELTRPCYFLLKSRLSRLSKIEVVLQQQVGNRLVKDTKTFTLRVWEYAIIAAH